MTCIKEGEEHARGRQGHKQRNKKRVCVCVCVCVCVAGDSWKFRKSGRAPNTNLNNEKLLGFLPYNEILGIFPVPKMQSHVTTNKTKSLLYVSNPAEEAI